ncbi:MAG: hypothetical protein SGPRY_007294 [Prymnesium sp.]
MPRSNAVVAGGAADVDDLEVFLASVSSQPSARMMRLDGAMNATVTYLSTTAISAVALIDSQPGHKLCGPIFYLPLTSHFVSTSARGHGQWIRHT